MNKKYKTLSDIKKDIKKKKYKTLSDFIKDLKKADKIYCCNKWCK